MTLIIIRLLPALAVATTLTLTVSAHHGSAEYDVSREVTITGTIKEWKWTQPHTWVVLKELLGQPNVKNYDGSWTEYGSLVGVPVALGDEKGEA